MHDVNIILTLIFIRYVGWLFLDFLKSDLTINNFKLHHVQFLHPP